MQTKTKSIGYWVTTCLLAAALLAGGSAQIAAVPETVSGIQRLGYPLYLLNILGVWKSLGAAALLAPGWPRLKEWAYAGIFFDLTGAVASHLYSGDAPGSVSPLVLLLVASASWALRPPSRTWGVADPERGRALGYSDVRSSWPRTVRARSSSSATG